MVYEVLEDKVTPGNWRVEGTDYESEGEVYVTIFAGSKSEERAKEYHAWLTV